MNVGIVVEGGDDLSVYPVLIKKIDSRITHVHLRECGGRQKLHDKFVVYLKEFAGNPAAFDISGVLVIRDSDCHDALPIEEDLRTILTGSRFQPPFEVRFHATSCKLESWLLADEEAINSVSRDRGGHGGIPAVEVDLEKLKEADRLYSSTLSQAGLPNTSAVMAEIARNARLDRIAQRCPRFREFMRKVQGL